MLTVPPGSELVLIESAVTGALAAAIERLNALVAFCAVAAESITWAVKLNVPEAVGVPRSDPADVNIKPAGSCPTVTLQVYGDVPPDAPKTVEYDVLTVPLGTLLVLMISGGADGVAAAIVMLNALVAFCAAEVESTTWAVKLNTPEAVGVPRSDPLDVNIKPAGSCPAVTLQVYGNVPPDAPRSVEYDVLTVPPGSALELIASVEADEVATDNVNVADPLSAGVLESAA